jgi:uncharacterized RDD family membrane protein YckC
VKAANADVLRRVAAFVVDGLIAAALATIPVVGVLAAALYILGRDGLMRGRSPGKRLLGLRVIKTPSRSEADYVDSVKRNAIFVLPDVLMAVPVLSATLAASVSVAVLAVELVFLLTDPAGMRLGDRFAGTRVTRELAEEVPRRAA